MVSSFSGETKEFVIHSNDEAGYVEVTGTCTLSDVRNLIIEEFDTEQLPSHSEEFAFKVNGLRLSQKQEARRNAYDLLQKRARVEIIPRVNNDKKRKIDVSNAGGGARENGKAADSASTTRKRMKVDALSNAVTPFINGNDKTAAVEKDNGRGNATAVCGDTSTANAIDTTTATSVDPTNLYPKFATNNDDNTETKESLGVENEKDKDVEDVINEHVTNKTNDEDDKNVEDDDKTVEFDGGDSIDNNNDNDFDNNHNDIDDQMSLSDDSGEKKSPEISFDEARAEAAKHNAEKKTDSSQIRLDADSDDDDLMEDLVKNASDEMDNQVEVVAEDNPHKEADEAKEKSRQVLKELSDMLNNNQNFCSENRKDDWMKEINQLTKKASPQTVFGVLGNTGV